MMGRTHALSGAVAMLATLTATNWHHSSLPTLTVATLTATGAALLPDLDHPHSTISRSLGPLSRVLSNLVAAIAGGHRHATHSLLGTAAATLATAALVAAGRWPLLICIGFLIALGAGSLGLTPGRTPHLLLVATAIGLLTLAIHHGADPTLTPLAVAVGCASHIAGDLLTGDGVALFHPLRSRVRVAGLRTGGVVEKLLVGPSLGIMAVVLVWTGGGR